MEILEAFKAAIPAGDEALIYEFRGRYRKPPEGQGVVPSRKLRSFYVAAENLYDAILHLHTYRSNFLAHEAIFRGRINIHSRDRKRAMKILERRLRRSKQQTENSSAS